MNTISMPLTNGAYGFPKGHQRTVKPTILAVLHQTANAATAVQERSYANRTGSGGPSATVYIDQSGSVVRAINADLYAAWSQGDVTNPVLTIPTVKAAVGSGRNFNEWVYESVEVCGQGVEPFNAAQFESVAQLVAAASKKLGIPVNRNTVLTHRDINTVNRPSDPWPAATREARLARVIDRANAILKPPVAAAPHDWNIMIAGGTTTIYIATVVAGRIVRWTERPWAGNASSAPCLAPQTIKGLFSGEALVAKVTKGVFVDKYVRCANGVSAE